MSSISNFLNTAMTIDQQESNSETNYDYEKEQLGAMYDEQKQQLIDSAMQSLPFGIAETSRAVGGLWQTGKQIYAFKAKYSPQIEAFKAKAASMYENIGKEGGEAVDYTDLLKSAGTSLGKRALALAAPEVLKRTGIDLNKAVNATQGEGGSIEAGLANLKEQGVNVVKTKASGLVEEGITRVKAAAAPVVETVQRAITEGQRPAFTRDEVGVEGVGAERAVNPFTRAVGGGETANPLFEGVSEAVLARHTATVVDATKNATDDAVKLVAGKTKAVIDTYKKSKTELQGKFDEAQGNLSEAQAKVTRLQAKAPLEPRDIPSRTMYPAERGRAPTLFESRSNPDLEQAKAEVATHQATIAELRDKATELKTTTSSAFEEASTSLKSVAGSAFEAGKTALGVAGEGLGVYGAVEAGMDLARGNVGGEQGTNDAAGLYFGGRSVQGLTQKGVAGVQKLTGAGEKVTEKVAVEGAEKAGAKVAEEGAIKVGTSTATELGEQAGAKVGAQLGEKIGVGLAEEGAELGAAALGATAIPVVGEAIDIGLGLYTAIDSIINLFKSPPKPPPPPPPAQQVIAVTHQQGVY